MRLQISCGTRTATLITSVVFCFISSLKQTQKPFRNRSPGACRFSQNYHFLLYAETILFRIQHPFYSTNLRGFGWNWFFATFDLLVKRTRWKMKMKKRRVSVQIFIPNSYFIGKRSLSPALNYLKKCLDRSFLFTRYLVALDSLTYLWLIWWL